MELFNIGIDNWNVNIEINLIVLAAICVIIILIKMFANRQWFNKRFQITNVDLPFLNGSITLAYCEKDREIAYKIWAEMSTRKIGLKFDPENDVIVEVYDSWYAFFGIARELLKEVPVSQVRNIGNVNGETVVGLTCKVLNEGLRPHLTKWQARFRYWYDRQRATDNNPQDIQREFPKYKELVEDLKTTNETLITYMDLMRKIALEKK